MRWKMLAVALMGATLGLSCTDNNKSDTTANSGTAPTLEDRMAQPAKDSVYTHGAADSANPGVPVAASMSPAPGAFPAPGCNDAIGRRRTG